MKDTTAQAKNKISFKITPARGILLVLGLLSICLIVYRLINGLGVTTNLNDQWPWGLWIFIDLAAIALAGCGFSIAVITHVFHIKKFKPLTRRALLLSFLLYIVALLILFIEIGRWDNFYTPIYSFAFTSPLYEVFMCIVLYFLMQAIELLDISIERFNPPARSKISKIMPVVVIIACLLPFGHQASLGAMYLGMPQKLSAIWSSAFLPWSFLINSFFAGLAVVVLEYHFFSKHYRQPKDNAMMTGLTRVIAVIMLGYFVLKIIDLAARGAFGLVFDGSLEGNMFLLEMVIGVIIPIIFGLSSLVKKTSGQIFMATFVVIGLLLSRFNVIFVGMIKTLGNSYVPSWIEIAVIPGLFALAIFIYLFAVENLPIFQAANREYDAFAGREKHAGYEVVSK